jgi:Protein of unknown function (DUF2865)
MSPARSYNLPRPCVMLFGLSLAVTCLGTRIAFAEASGGFFSALFSAFGGQPAEQAVGDLNDVNRNSSIVHRKRKKADFSSGQASWGETACAAECPDASSALYFLRGGVDKIANSVSSRGEPYTALPVALRYRTTLDNSCSCHRSAPNGDAEAILRDVSLRRGDVIMTDRGFVLFNGEPHRSPTQNDLIPLARASGLGKESRAMLFAMEHAGVPYRDNQNVGATSESVSPPNTSATAESR